MSAQKRRELVRQYVFELVDEGTFKDVKTVTAAIAKASTVFFSDATEVVGEILHQGAKMGGNKLAADMVGVARGIVDHVIDRITTKR